MTSRKLLKGEYDDVDVDDLLTQLSAEELEMLAKEVDPDVSAVIHKWQTTRIQVHGRYFLTSFNFVLFCLFVVGYLQDRFLPPDQRTNYQCDREPTGPVDRKQLIDHINKIALETPDQPESVPYVAGIVRGKKVLLHLLCKMSADLHLLLLILLRFYVFICALA